MNGMMICHSPVPFTGRCPHRVDIHNPRIVACVGGRRTEVGTESSGRMHATDRPRRGMLIYSGDEDQLR